MRTTTTLSFAALLLLGVTACGKSDADVQAECVTAIKARAEGDTAKPTACQPLSDDDYRTLIISHVIDTTGVPTG